MIVTYAASQRERVFAMLKDSPEWVLCEREDLPNPERVYFSSTPLEQPKEERCDAPSQSS